MPCAEFLPYFFTAVSIEVNIRLWAERLAQRRTSYHGEHLGLQRAEPDLGALASAPAPRPR